MKRWEMVMDRTVFVRVVAMAAMVTLAGCAGRSSVLPANAVPEVALVEPASARVVETEGVVDDGGADAEPVGGCEASFGVPVADESLLDRSVVEGLVWVIEQAEAQQERGLRASCDTGSVEVQLCRALWLATILDPVDLWLAGVIESDRERAVAIVDDVLADAADASGQQELDDLRWFQTRLFDSIEWGDEAIATALVERNDSAMVDQLRALERSCSDG